MISNEAVLHIVLISLSTRFASPAHHTQYDYPLMEKLKGFASYLHFDIFDFSDPLKNQIVAQGRAPIGWPTHQPCNKTEMQEGNVGVMMNRKSFDMYARRLARMLKIEVRMVEIFGV